MLTSLLLEPQAFLHWQSSLYLPSRSHCIFKALWSSFLTFSHTDCASPFWSSIWISHDKLKEHTPRWWIEKAHTWEALTLFTLIPAHVESLLFPVSCKDQILFSYISVVHLTPGLTIIVQDHQLVNSCSFLPDAYNYFNTWQGLCSYIMFKRFLSVFMCLCTGASRGQKRLSDALELKS